MFYFDFDVTDPQVVYFLRISRDIVSPDMLSPDMRSPDMRSLDITCPGILSPDILPLDYGIDAEGAGEDAAEDTAVYGHAWSLY